jgi:CRP-like cAMP-binding protein
MFPTPIHKELAMSSSEPTHRGRANHILAALNGDEYDRLGATFELVTLPIKSPLLAPDQPVAYIHFPTAGVHSVTALMYNGASVEVGLIDKDGVVGAHEALARATPTSRCFTQVAGEAVRVPVQTFLDEFARGGHLQRAVLRWMEAYIVQISQTAACNRLHSVYERLARWLLMCHDRTESNELPLTQEFLSIMLATPRPAITKAIGRLTERGCISHSRGAILVADRERLEGAACECYMIGRAALEHSVAQGARDAE